MVDIMSRILRNIVTIEIMDNLKLLQLLPNNDINITKHMLQTTLNNED